MVVYFDNILYNNQNIFKKKITCQNHYGFDWDI